MASVVASTAGGGQASSAPELLRCTNCDTVLAAHYVECAECVRPALVQLCVTCFGLGAELGAHRRSHNYRVRSAGGVVFGGGGDAAAATAGRPWGSYEEVALLEAVERYNLGNWEDVASALSTCGRSVQEIRDHYDKYYLRGAVGRLASRGFTRPSVDDRTEQSGNAAAWSAAGGVLGDSPDMLLGSPPLRTGACKANADDLSLLAYMPLRDDFEKEWNNDAEELVSQLIMAEEDDQLDRDVKQSMIDMYVRVTRRRRRLKATVRDHDLVSAFFKQEKPSLGSAMVYCKEAKQRMKAERTLKDKLQPFCQCTTADELTAYVDSVIKIDRLKQRIEELQEYRKKGIKTLEEAAGYRLLYAPAAGGSAQALRQRIEQGSASSSSWRRRRTRRDAAGSACSSTTPSGGRTCGGSASAAGRRSSPTATPVELARREPTTEHSLCPQELKFCDEHRLSFGDYTMLKLAVLADYRTLSSGGSVDRLHLNYYHSCSASDTDAACDVELLPSAVKRLLASLGWVDHMF